METVYFLVNPRNLLRDHASFTVEPHFETKNQTYRFRESRRGGMTKYTTLAQAEPESRWGRQG